MLATTPNTGNHSTSSATAATGNHSSSVSVQQRQCANRFFGLMTLRRLFQPILGSRRKRSRNSKQNTEPISDTNAKSLRKKKSKNNINHNLININIANNSNNNNSNHNDRNDRNDRNPNANGNDNIVNGNTIDSQDTQNETDANQRNSNQSQRSNEDVKCKQTVECPLCIESLPEVIISDQLNCKHRVCDSCLQRYLCIEIDESRVDLKCPCCDQQIHPNLIPEILKSLDTGAEYVRKYEKYMLRRVLIAEQDARWCPAPDCNYIVIASKCASCPYLQCARPECKTKFCYHCKQQWHRGKKCQPTNPSKHHNHQSPFRQLINGPRNASSSGRDGELPAFPVIDLFARAGGSDTMDASNDNTRSSVVFVTNRTNESSQTKPCPNCGVLIFKLNDGSCNHMTCIVCSTEFCWLCMKRISDLHYLSPSGCTFWGKKQWSRRKKILWQIGMLIGAPVGIALIAGIAIPTIVIGIPIWFGRKLRAQFNSQSFGRRRRTLLVTSGVIGSALVSPFVAAFVVGIGVPVMLTYVYGVVPLTLIRSGGCGLSTFASGVRIEVNDPNDHDQIIQNFDNIQMSDDIKIADDVSVGAMSESKSTTNASIGEFSMAPSQCTADDVSQSVRTDMVCTVNIMESDLSAD